MLKHVRFGSVKGVSSADNQNNDTNTYDSGYSSNSTHSINPSTLPKLDSSTYINHWQDKLCSPDQDNVYDDCVVSDYLPPPPVMSDYSVPHIRQQTNTYG